MSIEDSQKRSTPNLPLDRRTLIRNAFTAAAGAAGVGFLPVVKTLAGQSCADPEQVVCTAQDLLTVRQRPGGAEDLHAVAQELAASAAPSSQLEYLSKLYAKTSQIRGGPTLACGPVMATYHY